MPEPVTSEIQFQPDPLNTELLIAQHDDHAEESLGSEELQDEYGLTDDITADGDHLEHGDEHHGEGHGKGHGDGHDYPRHFAHLPENPHFIQIMFEWQKAKFKEEGKDPYGDPAGGGDVNLIQGLHVGYLEEPVPFLNYGPWENNVFAALAAIFICVVAFFVTGPFRNRSLEDRIKRPTRLQSCVELVVSTFDEFVEGVLGKEHARSYLPYAASLFLLILVMNLMGVVPLMKAPTASILITGSLAICSFCVYQFVAWTKLGPKEYFMHLAGYPKSGVEWLVAPLLIGIEALSDFILKPLSLTLRLFGNILGKDILLGVILLLCVSMSSGIFGNIGHFWGFPMLLAVPIYMLAMLLSAIQALVFALLSTIYILLVLPHDHH